jgi:riboflavin synthase
MDRHLFQDHEIYRSHAPLFYKTLFSTNRRDVKIMFTGLIETTGRIARLEKRGPGVSLSIETTSDLCEALTLGESVAVDGACLTVTKTVRDQFLVDASSETLARTTLGRRKMGDLVHLERALRVGDRLGGHWVSGHIDATGILRQMTPLGEAVKMWFDAPPEVMRYLVAKGSIAIDGASLTVNEIDDRGFSIVLIPHSQSILTFNKKTVGSSVNLEADILGKYVERLLSVGLPNPYTTDRSQVEPSPVDYSLLARTGFMK